MLAAAGMTACALEPIEVDECGTRNEVKFVMDDSETKSTLYTTLGCRWEDGDAIGVFCPETNAPSVNTEYRADLTTGKAIFSYSGSDEAPVWNEEDIYHNFIIYYPYKSNVDDMIYKGTLPSTQAIEGWEIFVGAYNFQYAKVSGKRTSDGTIPIREMKRQFGVIEFQIICDDPDGLGNKEISKVTYLPSKAIPCGDYSFNLENGTLSWTGKTTTEYSVSCYTWTSVLTYSTVKNAIRSVYMLVPPGSPVQGTYRVEIDGKTYSVTRDDSRTIEAGDYYTVSFVKNDSDDSFLDNYWISSEGNKYYMARKYRFDDGEIYHEGDPYYYSYTNPYADRGIAERIYVAKDDMYVGETYEYSEFKHQLTGKNSGHIEFGDKKGGSFSDYIDYRVDGDNAYISRNGGKAMLFSRADGNPAPQELYSRESALEHVYANNLGYANIKQPANCFVATSNEGWVVFRPYKGNSKELAVGDGIFAASDVHLGWDQPKRAAQSGVLESEKTVESVALKTLPDGDQIVMAKIAGAGNAVIKSTGILGTIWSWHIWVLDDYNTPAAINLGGFAPNEAGLYYQWGRKDPFTRPGTPRHGDQQSWLHGSYYDDLVEATTRYYFSLSDEAMDDVSLWSPYGKSEYDPCPRGYRVPDSSDFSASGLPEFGYIDEKRNFNSDRTIYWNCDKPGACYVFRRYSADGENTYTEPYAGHVRCVRYMGEPIE